METPLLYRQLQDQLRQWVRPKDQRHLQGFSEIVAAILQSQSACLGEWITDLRGCFKSSLYTFPGKGFSQKPRNLSKPLLALISADFSNTL